MRRREEGGGRRQGIAWEEERRLGEGHGEAERAPVLCSVFGAERETERERMGLEGGWGCKKNEKIITCGPQTLVVGIE